MNAIIDIRRDPVGEKTRKRRWYTNRTSQKIGACIHHSGNAGGTGIHKNRAKLYRNKPMDFSRFLKVPEVMTPDDYVKAQALAHRYMGDKPGPWNRGVPYHALYNPWVDVLYYNRPFEMITWAGHGSNTGYLQLCWDASSLKDGLDPTPVIRAFVKTIEDARAEGHPIREITCHCCWSNKPHDPGAVFIVHVAIAVAQITGCEIRWDFKVNNKRALTMREVLQRGGFND